ncbi:imelysin family protein [Methylocella sp.]|uniref:imelysin family protein n=1 Tax=Methylocella sp. TaxID=1978226 RepID=UPI003783EEC3
MTKAPSPRAATFFAPRRVALAAFIPPILAAALLAQGARAAPKLDPAPLVVEWLMPRYDTLAAAAADQKKAWAQFCGRTEPASLDTLKSAFIVTANAWNAVEFVTFGPAARSLRADRFSFFPDRRNAVARGLADLVADPSPDRLEPQRFAALSAAVQGLPALERLLFDEKAAAALAAGPESKRRCAIGQAVAGNLATIASEIRSVWGDRTQGLVADLAAKKGDPDYFPDPDALPGMILTDLAGAYQRVDDQKIAPVMGDSADEAKPLAADGWRAGRSGQVVVNMIESADALLREAALQTPDPARRSLALAADAADAAAKRFPLDLGAAAKTAEGRADVAAAVKAFKAAQTAVVNTLAPSLDVTLGFNALDGD